MGGVALVWSPQHHETSRRQGQPRVLFCGRGGCSLQKQPCSFSSSVSEPTCPSACLSSLSHVVGSEQGGGRLVLEDAGCTRRPGLSLEGASWGCSGLPLGT